MITKTRFQEQDNASGWTDAWVMEADKVPAGTELVQTATFVLCLCSNRQLTEKCGWFPSSIETTPWGQFFTVGVKNRNLIRAVENVSKRSVANVSQVIVKRVKLRRHFYMHFLGMLREYVGLLVANFRNIHVSIRGKNHTSQSFF